ncbi:MAG: lipoprotein signal peptidase [Bacteroidales bacterium]|nr:lipoprotein signal peptidase [Bacteroidales bacterium]
MKKSLFLIGIVLILDQSLKFWIKTNMTLGQEFNIISNWFIIHFTENEGMAFGLTFGGEFGKLALSMFRILAIAAIGYYLYNLNRQKAHTGLTVSISLILAGAIGNILDSAFYGLIFSNSSYHTVATLLPEIGGYATFLHGKVVDMLYFPIIQGHYPDWFPLWGGEDFIFFRPVFNIADSSITIGVFILILFQRKFFPNHKKDDEEVVNGDIATIETTEE